MHKELSFSIECRYKQIVWDKYTTYQGVMSSASNKHTTYDAMDDISLIPSLKALVEGVTEKKRQETIKKWIRQYGFLTSPSRSAAEGHEWEEENLEKFWSKAKQLVGLWDIYRMITNRKVEELKEIVSFHDTRIRDINGKIVPFGPGITGGTLYPQGIRKGVITISAHTLFFDKTLEEINDNPLRFYQIVAFQYIETMVERELKGISLIFGDVHLAKGIEQDNFKNVPIIEANSLLQALYLQFYILLSTPGKKICEACYKPFKPTRKDRIYCNEACKNTAKSRRYRGRLLQS